MHLDEVRYACSAAPELTKSLRSLESFEMRFPKCDQSHQLQPNQSYCIRAQWDVLTAQYDSAVFILGKLWCYRRSK